MSDLKEVKSGSQTLALEDMLGAQDIEIREVPIPEWPKNGKPGVIKLRTLTADQAIKFQRAIQSGSQEVKDESTLHMLAASAIDDNGELFLTPASVKRLREKSVKVFNRLQREMLDLNGFIDPKKAEAAAGNA